MSDADVLWRARSHPVLVPGLLGFVVGVSVWLLLLRTPESWFVGRVDTVVVEIAAWLVGTVGSVVGGATAAWLTDGGLRRNVRHAALADLVSSTLFLLGFAVQIAVEHQRPYPSVVDLLYSFVTFAALGSFLGSPIVVLTLTISVLSGAATSVALDRRRRGPEPAGTPRK